MSSLLNFLQSEHLLALLIALLIFLTTILLVVKRWIGFPITLLLLVFTLAAGLLINYNNEFRRVFTPSANSLDENSSPDDFQKQMLSAMENLKVEMATEKENLRRVVGQVQEIFESMDIQKQKLQSFIEEVRDRFQTEYSANSSSAPVAKESKVPPTVKPEENTNPSMK